MDKSTRIECVIESFIEDPEYKDFGFSYAEAKNGLNRATITVLFYPNREERGVTCIELADEFVITNCITRFKVANMTSFSNQFLSGVLSVCDKLNETVKRQ